MRNLTLQEKLRLLRKKVHHESRQLHYENMAPAEKARYEEKRRLLAERNRLIGQSLHDWHMRKYSV